MRIFTFTFLMMFIPLFDSDAQQFDLVDKVMAPYTGDGVPGASLAIIRDGKIIYRKAYGYSDPENNVRAELHTNYRLASVTKQFTAAGVLLLVNEGKLSLDSRLTDHFEGFPAYGREITVRQLLNHTSGLEDYEDYVPDSALVNQILDQGVLEIVKKLNKGYFTPGSQYRYSNTAYALLALLIEKYSGKSYAAFLDERIFKPLGMNKSVAYVKGVSEVEYRAFGYSKDAEGRWYRRDQSSTSAVLGDGGIYSSIRDLFLWDQSLYTSRILPQETIRMAFSPNKTTDGQPVAYGLGWHLKTSDRGEEVVYHTGSTTSFRNVIYRIPSARFTVILLTNRNKPDENNMLALAEEIASVCECK